MIKINSWIRIALFNFLIVVILGTFMRFAFLKELFFLDYIHFQTAHWHVALFGWIYQVMFASIIGAFLSAEQQTQKKYQVLFWLNQILIIVIFITLITAGYSLFSVSLDICFFILICIFVFLFLRDLKTSYGTKKTFSASLLKVAFFFLLLSFAGTLAIIPIDLLFSARRSVFYYLSTQFFLHFQYNGWFIFGILSLFFRMVENYGIQINETKFIRFKWITFFAAIITYFLNIYWGFPGHLIFLWIASLGGGVLQFSALMYIRKDMARLFAELKPRMASIVSVLLKISYISFIIKLILQIIIADPPVASVALTIRNYTIAYFHLAFLCITSVFIIAWNIHHKQFRVVENNNNTGIYVFSIGLLVLELTLFFQGTLLWMGLGFFPFYYEIVFFLTLTLLIGLILIIFQYKKHSYFGVSKVI